MSGSESLRGNVPAALEELRSPRSGGCLVWFFELLWAFSPESRGLLGTDNEPGLMMRHVGKNSKESNAPPGQRNTALNSSSSSSQPQNFSPENDEDNDDHNNNLSHNNNNGRSIGPHPDLLWRGKLGNNNSNTLANNVNNNMNHFGMWEEETDELSTIAPDQPHDDFLWLPVLPPTVLLNFSRIQSWYFTPKSRMQMQREVAFYSVANEDDAKRVYGEQSGNYFNNDNGNDGENGGGGGGGGGDDSNNNSRNTKICPAQNDIDRLLAQYHQRESENKRKRDSQVKSKFREAFATPSALIKAKNSNQNNNSNGVEDFTSNNDDVNNNMSSMIQSINNNNSVEKSQRSPLLPKNASSLRKNSISANDLPEPERQLTLSQRQCLGVRAIAERYKREHSSNGDELPAPVLKRLRGRLSTGVIVDAFEREYCQGLRVENLTAHGLAMQQAGKDKKNSAAASLLLAQMMDDDDDTKKKRKIHIRHHPVGWICPEGPEQQQLQYDRIVALLIRKSSDSSSTASSNFASSSSSNNKKRKKISKNNNNQDDYDDEGDDHSFASAAATTAGKPKTVSTLPSAAQTAELLSQSLSSPYVEYLTMESLRRVLCNGTLGQAALLQQFVPPPPPSAIGNARYNETLDFRWQPHWRYLERCTNAHPLDDYTVPASKRGPTFEGAPGASQGAMLAQATLYRLERACRAIVRHVFVVSQFTARILRLHCIFKFDDKLTLVLLCAVEAYAINPRAIPPATTIANILNADAHLPRMKTALAQHKQQEQLQQFQQAHQQQMLVLKQQQNSAYTNNSNGNNKDSSLKNNQQRDGSNNNKSNNSPPHHQKDDFTSPPISPSNQGNNNRNPQQQQNDNKLTRQDRKNYLQQRENQNALLMVSASMVGEQVTATGWEAVALDPDDVRRSPIRALAAMSRGDARHASIRQTMRERVGALEEKKEMKMIMDTQGVVKPLEQLRKEADAAFAAINPKAAKALDALFSRREKRRALMKAGNSSAFDENNNNNNSSHLRPSSVSAKYSSSSSNNNNQNRRNTNNNDDDDDNGDDGDDDENQHSYHQGSGATAAMKLKKRRANTTQFTEASETIDDLLWGRQSQLARALLRPVASRDDARKLPFHRRPARSLAAECGASGVGDRYIGTMRNASTPEPQNGTDWANSKPEVQHRRAFF